MSVLAQDSTGSYGRHEPDRSGAVTWPSDGMLLSRPPWLTALCIGATWLFASTIMTRVFFISLFVSMGISTVIFYPKRQ